MVAGEPARKAKLEAIKNELDDLFVTLETSIDRAWRDLSPCEAGDQNNIGIREELLFPNIELPMIDSGHGRTSANNCSYHLRN